MFRSFRAFSKQIILLVSICLALPSFSSISYAGWRDKLKQATKQFEESIKTVPTVRKKVNAAEIAGKHGFNDADSLDRFISRDLHFVFSGQKEKWEDENLYAKISSLYEDVKGYEHKDFDGSDPYLTRLLMRFKQTAEMYLANRETQLASLKEKRIKQSQAMEEQKKRAEEEERERAQEKQRQMEQASKAREEAPGQIVSQYRDSPKPRNLARIKGWIDLLSKWKVGVFKDSGEWGIAFIQLNEGTNDHLVFERPPIDASSHRKKYILVFASIDRKFGTDYLISNNSSEEAIAVISKNVISDSGVGFGENCYMICSLVDVVNVETVLGTTKPVSKLRVKGILKYDEYQKFRNYVLGHPQEFPHQRYVEISW